MWSLGSDRFCRSPCDSEAQRSTERGSAERSPSKPHAEVSASLSLPVLFADLERLLLKAQRPRLKAESSGWDYWQRLFSSCTGSQRNRLC